MQALKEGADVQNWKIQLRIYASQPDAAREKAFADARRACNQTSSTRERWSRVLCCI